jgi:hypothetical protein
LKVFNTAAKGLLTFRYLQGLYATYMGHGWKPTFDIFTEKSSSNGFVFLGTDCNPQIA